MTTIAFYKPDDVLCKFTDSEGRPTLGDYIDMPNIYPAGRLDKDSEGLLILTDDGALQNQIASPKHKQPKVYLAQVEHIPDEQALQELRDGVVIKERKTRPAEAQLLETEPDLPPRSTPIRYRKNVPTAWLALTLYEGRNRQVRRMTAAVGYPTLRLVRVGIGPVTLEGLQPGEWRYLSEKDIKKLRNG